MNRDSEKYHLLIENLPDAFAYHQIVTDDDGTPVELSALVNVCLKELQAREPHRQVEMVITPGLVAEADTAFQRLHDAKAYPGTGIGLSIVSRIISRHSGEIWAEGEPGKGACFFFTLS